jgi:hypothetical protein
MTDPMAFAEPPATNATTTLESAVEFGLSNEEILEAVMATIDDLPDDARTRCVDELAGALAHRLIEKQREF